MPQWYKIKTQDDYKVPTRWFSSEKAVANILFLPALGTKARYYSGFGKSLAGSGFNVAVMEQRGHGESAVRPSRKLDYGYKTYISDISSVIDWIKAQAPGFPVFLAGHSLGGHLAIACAGLFPETFAGIVLIACSSPYYKNYSGKWKLRLQVGNFMIPILLALFGYFPGKWVGFGGSEAKTLMRDWRQLAKHNRYHLAGIPGDIESNIAKYRRPALNIRFEKDALAPQKAVASINDKLKSARFTHVVLSEADLGCHAGHFEWAKHPACVSQCITDWVNNI